MIAYFPDDEIQHIQLSSEVKGLVNEEGEKPYAIVLDKEEVLTILTETNPKVRKQMTSYITDQLYNAVDNPKEINLTIA